MVLSEYVSYTSGVPSIDSLFSPYCFTLPRVVDSPTILAEVASNPIFSNLSIFALYYSSSNPSGNARDHSHPPGSPWELFRYKSSFCPRFQFWFWVFAVES